MKNFSIKALCILALASISIFQSCEKDDNKPQNPQDSNPQELITTVQLFFKNQNDTSDVYAYTAKDPDGTGGQPLTKDKIVLKSNATYVCSIVLLDETKNPPDVISNEVLEEQDDHQFFYNVNGTNLTVNYSDKDNNNLPLGLSTQWICGATGNGKVQLVLKHQPGVKKGSQADGDTDLEVEFDFETR